MPVGVGTELKRLLRKAGIKPCLSCDGRAIIMDEEGPEWCRHNIKLIVGWMREEAGKRGLPFVELGAILLVRLAIWQAKKKLKIIGSE